MTNVATMTSKGQVTVPASLRKKYGLKEGTRLVFVEAGDELRILREQDLDRMFAVFDRIRKDTKMTRKELDALVKRTKARLWSERYARRH
ncbi:MAG TPA: AbrB/MazE/SpoVT family DNA-binding domain-containing protein [Thermoplasmata archaeon]|nr:AbrB/MazE/SpoVT family DNA-binding domain-containing protein [Thermoplasmata archaeon]